MTETVDAERKPTDARRQTPDARRQQTMNYIYVVIPLLWITLWIAEKESRRLSTF
jgi:hypothetical protein